MPKYYCEYCDIYLTHSSPGGRRQHNAGRKHINNKIDYFFNLIRDPNFLPPPHILEAGFLGGFNMLMGGRQSILPHNPVVPALLRPPPLSQVNPWGNSLFMGRGVSPLGPIAGVTNPMMATGRGAPNFMVSQPAFRPRPFDRPQFA